jgi:PAS domain S-box-containing protein
MESLKKIILLVEDDPVIAVLHKRYVEKEGYFVLVAGNGEEAVEIIKNNTKVDLILMDINLGSGIDGTEAAKEILNLKEIPVLFLSSHTEKKIVDLTEKITSYGYVVKNTGPIVLAASIKMAFKLFEANKEISFNASSLMQSESRFNAVYEKSPVGIVHVDLKGKFLNVNPTFIKILQYSKEELLQMTWRDFTHPDDLQINVDLYTDVLEGTRDSYCIEKRYLTKSGQIVWVSISVVSVKDLNGKPIYLLGMVEDITDKVKIEESQKEDLNLLKSVNKLAIKLAPFSHNEDLYSLITKSLIKSSGADFATIAIYNPENSVLKIERIEAKSNLLSLANGVLGMNLLQIKPKVSDEDYKQILSKVVGFRKTITETTFGAINSVVGNAIQKITSIDKFAGIAYIIEGKLYGTSVLGFNKNHPYPSEELLKSFAHIIALSIQRKSLEDKFYKVDRGFRLTEEKFSKIFRTSPDAIILSRLFDGVFVEVNDSFQKMTGYSKDEVIGKSSFDEYIGIWAEGKDREKFVKALQLNSEINGFEIRLKKKDGTPITGLRSAKIIDIDGVQHILSITHDITERKRIREELEKSEAKYKRFFENTHDVYYQVNDQFLIVEISPSIEKVSGYIREELIGKPVETFYENPEDRDLFIQEITKKGYVKEYEVKLKVKSGQSKWVSLNANLILTDENKFDYIEGFIKEIDVRKNAELNLRKMARAVEQSSASILITDEKGIIEYINPKFSEISGYSINEILGKNSKVLSSGLTPKNIYKELWNTIKSGRDWKGEFSNKKKNGDIYIESASISPITNEFGNVTNFVAVKEDITERKLAESVLEEKEEFYHAIFDRSAAIKMLIEPETFDIVDANPAAETFYGYTRNELLKLKITDINLIDTTDLTLACEQVIDGSNRYFNFKHKLSNGEVKDVEVYSTKIQLRGKTLLYSLIHDITERKLAEAQNIKYSEELKNAIATKDKFFSIIAHDLKSPFNAIIGFSDLLEADFNNNDYTSFPLYIDSISKSSKNAFNLLETLLEWAMAQTGRIKFVPEKINLSSKIFENIELFESQAAKKNIQLKSNINRDLQVFCDKYMLSSILRNLIVNAIKFTPQYGNIFVSAIPKNTFIEVSIRDSGVGILPEQLEKLFIVEEKVSTYGTEKETGTGLGLILCKEFIDQNGGQIWVESEVGKGSTFFFTLPVA